jgi:hypothetical protein
MIVRRQRLTPSLLLSLAALYTLSSIAMLLLRTTGSAAFLLAGSGRPRVAATAAATAGHGSGWLAGAGAAASAGRRGLASKSGACLRACVPACVCCL